MNNIRNFLITAHIDHGKSTLADRLLEATGTVEKRLMKPQYLDQLELERERGITIKMAPVRMHYRLTTNNKQLITQSGKLSVISSKLSNSEYILNLIDTPGHSDFKYEVSRALAAVEGAVLLVDATQGIQAQTLANYESAKKADLKIIGAVNKIDAASPEQITETVKELSELLDQAPESILKVSGKTGSGVEELLEEIIKRIPPPRDKAEMMQKYAENIQRESARSDSSETRRASSPRESALGRALVFDSLYDDHKGVIAFVRVFNGRFETGEDGYLAAAKSEFRIKEVGYFTPALKSGKSLEEGEIGYIATGIKDADKLKIGDTILATSHWPLATSENLALPGYHEPKPVVFVSFYPAASDDYENLKKSISHLKLTDSALKFEPDMSEILGRGFKGGFLGRLHFEITAERLAREYKIETVHSFPSVAYQVKIKNNGWLNVSNPKDFPDDPAEILEPMAQIEILTPPRFLGAVLNLKDLFRFSDIQIKALGIKTLISAKMPLADFLSDLDDKLKSVSEGFASLDYRLIGYERGDVLKLEILVAEHLVPGLTRIVPKLYIEHEARATVAKLKDLLPKQQYVQAIQARVHGRISARETIPAARKLLGNFGKTGGDRTRKMKLWKKQQKGKKKLKEMASNQQVKIPAQIFKELLKK